MMGKRQCNSAPQSPLPINKLLFTLNQRCEQEEIEDQREQVYVRPFQSQPDPTIQDHFDYETFKPQSQPQARDAMVTSTESSCSSHLRLSQTSENDRRQSSNVTLSSLMRSAGSKTSHSSAEQAEEIHQAPPPPLEFIDLHKVQKISNHFVSHHPTRGRPDRPRVLDQPLNLS